MNSRARDRRQAARDQETAVCGSEGCEALAAMGRAYCLRCEEEINALDAWKARHDEMELRTQARAVAALLRSRDRAERWQRFTRGIVKRLWIPNLAVVVVGVVWIMWNFAATWIVWLGSL